MSQDEKTTPAENHSQDDNLPKEWIEKRLREAKEFQLTSTMEERATTFEQLLVDRYLISSAIFRGLSPVERLRIQKATFTRLAAKCDEFLNEEKVKLNVQPEG